MRISRSVILGLVATALLILPVACGGSTPANLNDIPVFEGAVPLEAGSNTIADTMVAAIQQGIASQNLNAATSLYRLPEGTQWQAVKDFYTAEIGGSWQVSPEMTQEAGVINIIGWQRGSGASEEALIVGQAQDPVSGDSFLLLGLFSE